MSGTHNGYGFPISGEIIKTYNENIFENIFGSIERGIYDSANIIGRFFGNATGSFSNSIGNSIGVPSFLIPGTILLVGSGSLILLIYLLIKK
jgi:hypothetical protein